MTADPSGTDDTLVASRLAALDDVPTADHLAVYTAIATELAARLDQPDEAPGVPSHTPPSSDTSGGTGG